MKFKDIFSIINSIQNANYIDLETYKILKYNDKRLKNVIKVPILPSSLYILALVKTLDCYLISHKDEEQYVKEKKEELNAALNYYNNLANNAAFEQNIDMTIVDNVSSIKEDMTDLDMGLIDEYYTTLNEIEYVKDWCINNNIYFIKDSYEDYVEQYKYATHVDDWLEDDRKNKEEYEKIGIASWTESDRRNIKEYEEIADIKIPNNAQWLFVKFEDFRHLLFEEKIIIKKEDYNDTIENAIQIGNWKTITDVNSRIRSILEDYIDDYHKYYLIYNLTEGKYNYYSKDKQNELLIFSIHDYGDYHLCVKKMII